jgi:hypothetical protein
VAQSEQRLLFQHPLDSHNPCHPCITQQLSVLRDTAGQIRTCWARLAVLVVMAIQTEHLFHNSLVVAHSITVWCCSAPSKKLI